MSNSGSEKPRKIPENLNLLSLTYPSLAGAGVRAEAGRGRELREICTEQLLIRSC